MVVEVVVGLATDSLALLSDAGHMLTDVLGIGMALAAIQLASRGQHRTHRTFGLYRLEILAALANAVLLLGVAGYVLVEADPPVRRRAGDRRPVPSSWSRSPGSPPTSSPSPCCARGSRESLNVEGAYLEVLADTDRVDRRHRRCRSSSHVTGWTWVDPVVGVAIAVWILPRTVAARRPGRADPRAGRPARAPTSTAMHADLAGRRRRRRRPRPARVDPHLRHGGGLRPPRRRRRRRPPRACSTRPATCCATSYGIGHATLQVEPDDHRGCDEIGW